MILDLTTASPNALAQPLCASIGWQCDEVLYAYNAEDIEAVLQTYAVGAG